MKEASKWTKKAFPNGPDPVKHSEETEFNITYIIGEVESDHKEHMPAFQYAAHHNWCIHCTGTHASEDHHLSLGISLVSNSGTTIVPLHQETKMTNEAISNTSDNYKIRASQRRTPPPPNPQAAHRLHWHEHRWSPWTLRGIESHPRAGLGSTRMGTTPGLGTTAATEPATSRMTLIRASLHHPIREYASPPPTTLTMTNYETSKTSTEKVRMMFIIISTNVRCGTRTLNRS